MTNEEVGTNRAQKLWTQNTAIVTVVTIRNSMPVQRRLRTMVTISVFRFEASVGLLLFCRETVASREPMTAADVRRRLREYTIQTRGRIGLAALYLAITFVRATTGGGMFVKRPLFTVTPQQHGHAAAAIIFVSCRRRCHCIEVR